MSSTADSEAPLDAEGALFRALMAWNRPLRQFSEATQMCVCAYDGLGRRQLGPFCTSPLGGMLAKCGHWRDCGLATSYERKLFAHLRVHSRATKLVIADTVIIAALPVLQGAHFAGMVTYGWSLAAFADPIACEKFARRFGLEGFAFWQVARQLSPVSSERFLICSKLLRTLISSIVYQINATRILEDNARAKDTFLAAVSHELKTPLTAIMLRTQGLLRGKRITDERDLKSLHIIERSAASQSRLIEDLLDASRTVSGKMAMHFSDIELGHILEKSAEVVQASAAAKGIELQVRCSVQGCHVTADDGRLQQVFLNLLNNAVKFTPAGGRVTFEASAIGKNVVVSVTDTGRGIGAEFLPFVFERFAQAGLKVSKQDSGLGLGLAISKYIIEQHGGTIAAFSDGIGEGASFRISLPRLICHSC